MNRFGYLEKISFKLTKCIGSSFSLFLHTLAFGGFFVLRYFGVAGDYIFLLLITAVCLEAIYLIIFIQMVVRNNTNSLVMVQGNIEEIKHDEEEAQKLMVSLLHLTHQIKTIQHDIEDLKKSNILKRTTRNAQRIQV